MLQKFIFCISNHFHVQWCSCLRVYICVVCCVSFWADNRWSFSDILCKVSSAVINTNAFCRIYFLVQVSIDHYVALVLSYERKSRAFTPNWDVCLCGVFTLHAFIYRKVKIHPQSNVSECTFNLTKDPYLMMERKIIFSFIIPVILLHSIRKALRNSLAEGLNTQRIKQLSCFAIFLGLSCIFFL